MAFKEILVEIDELSSAAQALEDAAEIYEEAVENVNRAAEDLESKWQGDGQVAFKTHQESAYNWHKSILQVVRDIAKILRQAIQDYIDMIDEINSTVSGR